MNASRNHESSSAMASGVLRLSESQAPVPISDEVYVRPGTVVGEKYVVEEVLGVGGMAFVVSARHEELDEVFALKFLGTQFLGNAPVVERFLREARAACRLASEHVVRVFDVGTHGGAPYLVMERLVGRDLGAVAAEGTLGVSDVVELVMQACEGLAAAHAMGVVHRDIKPENLFLVEQAGMPLVKILDFGISKHLVGRTAGAPRLTGEAPLGTPSFMAPEQIRSASDVDVRTDIWALGVVLYELLARTEAFPGGNVSEICAAVLEQEPQPLRSVAPHLPDGLADVVERCLRKDREERYANVAELASALAPFAPGRALLALERTSCRLGVAMPPRTTVVPASQPGARVSGAIEAAPISAPAAAAVPSRLRRATMVALAATVGLALAAGALAARSTLQPRADTPNVVDATGAVLVAGERRAVAEVRSDASEAVTVIGVRAKRPSEARPSGAAASTRKASRATPASASAPATASASASAPASATATASASAPAPAATAAIELGY